MTDPQPPPSSSSDPPRSASEVAVTRVVNLGRASAASTGSTLAPIRPSALLSERLHRPTMAGRFIITEEIARGGMGVIYRGHDPDLGRDLAIKVLKPERVDEADIVAMFFNEARICGRLQHPGIVPVHEVGTMADGSPFIAMRLVEGQTLARLLAERDRSGHDLTPILRIFEVVCQTLAYAHARGVIHRDLKPSNIMVGPFSEVQIMDWGLACEVDTGEAAPTTPSSEPKSVMGTPSYMAPEQARGTVPLDVRVDVFALGAILCEILTGAPPFPEGDGATLDRVCNGETQPALDRLHALADDSDLVDLACRCLAVDPALRPGDAGLVAMALDVHQSGVQERLRHAELQRAAAEARALAERASHRLIIGLVIVMLLGALGGWVGREKLRLARSDALASRSAHLTCETHRIETALSEARLLRAEARGHWTNPSHWETTLRRARAAVERAASIVADEDDLDGYVSLVDEARLDLESDDRDRRLLLTLDRIRMSKTDVRRYELAFAEAGMDLFGSSIEATASLVRARPISAHLAEVIEDWACLLKVGEDRRHRLFDIVSRIEPHPWRDRLRDALRTNERSSLVRLADEPFASMPPACHVRLANALGSAGESARAIAVLRQARHCHPTDFWINHRLGSELHQAGPGSLAEALCYYTAAQALRQDCPTLFLGIAAVHSRLGQAREAAEAARQAVALDPTLGEAAREFMRGQ